jgi:hypothetical protein
VKRLLITSLALLASCSFAPIRVPVTDLEIPGNSSRGLICYAPVPLEESPPVGFNGADYRATALYQSEGEGAATVTVYGRSTPPETPCVFPSSADLPLSGPLVLTPGAAQEVLIGGPEYGATLAELISEPGTYFGASLTGGVLLGLNERIRLTDGEISVYY